MELSDLLTRKEAAEYLKIQPQTLAAWSSIGRYDLPLIKVGRSVRYRLADLEKPLESRSITQSGELPL